jgi:hypothetical protein
VVFKVRLCTFLFVYVCDTSAFKNDVKESLAELHYANVIGTICISKKCAIYLIDSILCRIVLNIAEHCTKH